MYKRDRWEMENAGTKESIVECIVERGPDMRRKIK